MRRYNCARSHRIISRGRLTNNDHNGSCDLSNDNAFPPALTSLGMHTAQSLATLHICNIPPPSQPETIHTGIPSYIEYNTIKVESTVAKKTFISTQTQNTMKKTIIFFFYNPQAGNSIWTTYTKENGNQLSQALLYSFEQLQILHGVFLHLIL